MLVEVKVPALSESVAEATLLSWHKKAGEFVKRDENLIDIETDKVVLELPAPESGVLSKITTILADHGISIDAVLQRESAEGERQTDLIILTHDTVEGRLRQALAQMQPLPTVLAPIVSIRKEELA